MYHIMELPLMLILTCDNASKVNKIQTVYGSLVLVLFGESRLDGAVQNGEVFLEQAPGSHW